MKTWKIERFRHDDKIFELLKGYAKSLSDITLQGLKATIIPELQNDKTHYLFKVHDYKNQMFSIAIFDILLIDIEQSLINLTVKYFDESKSTTININELEKTIDEIISSKKMGNYMGYLISITKKDK